MMIQYFMCNKIDSPQCQNILWEETGYLGSCNQDSRILENCLPLTPIHYRGTLHVPHADQSLGLVDKSTP